MNKLNQQQQCTVHTRLIRLGPIAKRLQISVHHFYGFIPRYAESHIVAAILSVRSRKTY